MKPQGLLGRQSSRSVNFRLRVRCSPQNKLESNKEDTDVDHRPLVPPPAMRCSCTNFKNASLWSLGRLFVNSIDMLCVIRGTL